MIRSYRIRGRPESAASRCIIVLRCIEPPSQMVNDLVQIQGLSRL